MASAELKDDVDRFFDVFIEVHLRAEALSELVEKLNEKPTRRRASIAMVC